jgi:hypothetical protein
MRSIILGLFLATIPALCQAEGAKAFQPQATYVDEGDSAVPFSILCASTSWTALISSDTISRSVVYQAPTTNSATICLSTMTTTAIACAVTTPGIELPAGMSFSDNAKYAWYCRSKEDGVSADTRGYIKGRRSRDKGDLGYNR